MSEIKYNFEFYSNFSSNENDYEQLKHLVFQLFISLKKLYMNRIGSFFFKIFHNYGKSILKTESNHDQDFFVKRLKYQILQIKLGSMLNILLKHLQFNQIYFLSKMSLKINTQKVVYSHDNYLNIQTNKELQRHRNFAAYLKLLYVIRINHSKKLILKSYFLKFKDLIISWMPPKKTFLKYLLMKKISHQGEHYKLRKKTLELWKINVISAKNLLDLYNNPFAYSDNSVLKLLYFIIKKNLQVKKDFFSRIKSKVREEYETNNNNSDFFKQMTDELNIINSIISFKTKENYLIDPPSDIKQLNHLYLQSFKNLQKSLGENIKHYKSLQKLKGVYKLYCREYVEKRLYSYFNRWKTKSDLIGYELLNKEIHHLYLLKKEKTLTLLEKFLERFNNANLYYAYIFFERLILNAKLKNSLAGYGGVYSKIHYHISDQETKENILQNRVTFQKILTLRKTIAIINRIKYEGPRFDNHNKIIKSDDFKLNSCFLKWKKLTIISLQIENSKNTRICKLINSFESIANKRMFLFFKNLKEKNSSSKHLSNLKKLTLINLKTIIISSQIRLKSYGFSLIIKYYLEKEVYKKRKIKSILYNKIFCDKLGLKHNIRNRFKLWENKIKRDKVIRNYSIDSTKYIKNNKIFQIYKMYYCFKSIFMKKFFTLFKFKIKRIIGEIPRFSLNLLINENQARVCLELEKQDNLLTEHLERKKLSLFSSDILLKLFYRKHLNFNIFLQYFRAWKYKSITQRDETLISLMNVKSNMQVEYDYLVKELEDKKQTIEKIKEEYDIIKKNFCKNCVQEDQFLSIKKSNDFYMSNDNSQTSKPINKKNINHIEEKNKAIQQRNLLSNIVEMEEKINKLKLDYDQKLDANEKFLKIYEEKKNELTHIKNEIISKFKDKTK